MTLTQKVLRNCQSLGGLAIEIIYVSVWAFLEYVGHRALIWLEADRIVWASFIVLTATTGVWVIGHALLDLLNDFGISPHQAPCPLAADPKCLHGNS
jgi:hypothetical protein